MFIAKFKVNLFHKPVIYVFQINSKRFLACTPLERELVYNYTSNLYKIPSKLLFFPKFVHVFDKKIYVYNIVTFRQRLFKAIAIWSEQLAHQYCNIASQYCNLARNRTPDFTVTERLIIIFNAVNPV